MSVEIRLLGPDDPAVLDRVAADVFDNPVRPEWVREFLSDRRHHIVVALDDGVVVGMVSGVDYLHPDKAPQLFINEVGVAPSHHRRGLARRMLDAMLAHGRALGCTEAWVATDADNDAANALYRSVRSAPDPFVMYSFPLGGDE